MPLEDQISWDDDDDDHDDDDDDDDDDVDDDDDDDFSFWGKHFREICYYSCHKRIPTIMLGK